MKYFLCLLILIGFSYTTSSQTIVGGRLGYLSGVSYKKHYFKDRAIEGIIGTRPDGLGVEAKGLLELHMLNLKKIPYFNWYFGGGGHFGHFFEYFHGGKFVQSTYIGLDLVTGIEFRIPNTPLQIALDIIPHYEIYLDDFSTFRLRNSLGTYLDTGITFRYVLKQ